jgi:hypothetical protein
VLTLAQNLLSFCVLSKNVKIEMYRTVILSVVLRGYETRSLKLREQHRLRIFENRVVKKIVGLNPEQLIKTSRSEPYKN